MEYGLALAGGGTRGAAHAGVILALKEEKLLPTFIAGTSAGSMVAGGFAGGMEAEELCDTVHHLSKHGMEYLDPDIVGLMMLVPQLLLHQKTTLSGILKGNKLKRYFSILTKGQRLENIACPLLIPVVDILTGDTVCFTNIKKNNKIRFCGREGYLEVGDSLERMVQWEKSGKLCDIMMASCSVPGIFRPIKYKNRCLVDGGVTDNLPVNLFIKAGVKNVVAVDIGSDYEMPEEEGIFEILSHSFSVMSNNLKECRSTGEVLLLKPEITTKAGLLTFEYMEQCMEDGYAYTKKNAGRIRKAINC
ncbi:MAG: patatin-like phospholipase family protein [Clostridium sp.]